MNFKRFGRTAQLFDASTAVIGKRVNASGTETNADMAYSDYIDVQGVSKLTVSHKPAITNFYFYEEKTPTALSYVNGYTADVPVNAKYCRINLLASDVNVTMLNAGDTALPYEPYGSAWHDIPHYIMGTSTDTLTTLPAVLYPNDSTATVGLKGDMQQSSQPSTTTPIQPSETGERTGNLFDKDNTTVYNAYINEQGYWALSANSRSVKIPCEPNTEYTIKIHYTGYTGSFRICQSDDATVYPYSETAGPLLDIVVRTTGISEYTFTTSSTAKIIVFQGTGYPNENTWIDTMTLTKGSTAPTSYSPYGYKIPILNNSQTTNVYLGEVESIRRIKKLVLDGTEDWQAVGDSSYIRRLVLQGYARVLENIPISTHYKGIAPVDSYFNIPNLCTALLISSSGNNYFYINDENYASLNAFKAYLAQQYAAGTPVCVWYVLATPTTGIVNEPIRKINTYADSVSGITIPVTAGANTLSIGTTLQPSEVTATYKGWHPVTDVHERENSAWD